MADTASGGSGPFDRSFIHAAAIPMVLSDPHQPDNPLVEVNDAFCALTGYLRSDHIGRNCRFMQGAGTQPGSVDVLRRGIAERRCVVSEVLNYKADGTAFLNTLLIGPVFDADRQLIYFVGSQIETALTWQAQRSAEAARLIAGLSVREGGVLDLLALGKASKEIAIALDLSPRTIEMHRARLMKKLGTTSLPQALRLLFEAEGAGGKA